MKQVEVIMRTERRRKYSDAFRWQVVAEAEHPDVTVVSVVKKYDIAISLFYRWRNQFREKLQAAHQRTSAESLEHLSGPSLPDSYNDFVYAGEIEASVPVSPRFTDERTCANVQTQRIEVILPNGLKLNVGDQFNGVTLLRLVRVLGGES